LTDSGRSEEKCPKGKEEPKSLQVAGTVVPRQKVIGCCAREKAASKSTSWGGGKRSQLFETPHFSFLPSLAACCVGVFLFFEISKLENVAIKLVEFDFGKEQISQLFFVKKGKFCF
jgi:hypothetical protein